jgi:hypothetical protein
MMRYLLPFGSLGGVAVVGNTKLLSRADIGNQYASSSAN